MIEEPAPIQRLDQARAWLYKHLSPSSRPPRTRLLLVAVIIFFVTLGVRILYWQDIEADLVRGRLIAIDSQYKIEAKRMRKEGGLLFPRTHEDAGDAQMLLHPVTQF